MDIATTHSLIITKKKTMRIEFENFNGGNCYVKYCVSLSANVDLTNNIKTGGGGVRWWVCLKKQFASLIRAGVIKMYFQGKGGRKS